MTIIRKFENEFKGNFAVVKYFGGDYDWKNDVETERYWVMFDCETLEDARREAFFYQKVYETVILNIMDQDGKRYAVHG